MTVAGYFRTLSPERRTALGKIRSAVKAAVPRAEECISYQIPAFRLDGRMLVWYAAMKEHCSFFPGAYAIASLKPHLKKYKTSKGTIRFSPDTPLSAALVRKLVRARISERAGR